MASITSMQDEIQIKKLVYSIHKCSSHSTAYVPTNILLDKANDQSSRWSSESNNPPQFLILKLNKYAIVRTITFGKYEKTHVCNLKKFKVFGGLAEENMLELLDGGLKNDCKPETFSLRYTTGGHPFATRYLKIVPLQSWGPSFNFTIWFVELMGVDTWKLVKPAIEWVSTYKEKAALRLCLKYLRQMNYQKTFRSLLDHTRLQLEDPQLTELFDIVHRGDYTAVEEFMENSVNSGLLSSYISKLDYRPTWQCIVPERPKPRMRGGHQMCLDPYSETIYLLGGWDGHQDLSDLWAFHIPTGRWSLISVDTEADGGPSPRSCHKICLDPERRQIFTLGRYLDTQCRTTESLKSDFYVYDIENNHWTLITDDTSTMGGPNLIFDHQMCMDVACRTIYVFGGRVLSPYQVNREERGNNSGGLVEPIYSGLYSYHVSTNTWKILCSDSKSDSSTPTLKSRVGHSMLFHPMKRKLYIFAGQRVKDYLNDFFSYDVDSGVVEYLCQGSGKDNNCLPAAGFTQRATIDPDLDEIYVLSGLSKDKEKRDDNVQNSFWVFYIKQNKWSCVYRNENTGIQYWSKMEGLEPCPRFAHQLVYDHICKVHYLFGGNPGMACLPKLRLDDFWKLQLSRPTNPQLLQQCKVLIRKYRYKELASTDCVTALNYLQTSVCEVIDHNDPEQSRDFQDLPSYLFLDMLSSEQREEALHKHRSKLFDELSTFFPESMTQPQANLIDIVPI